MFFSVITKDLNREILTKNLDTFKRWDEVKDGKFLKISREGGGHEKPIYKGGIAGKGGLRQFADLRWAGGVWA